MDPTGQNEVELELKASGSDSPRRPKKSCAKELDEKVQEHAYAR
jgi:hypothetical protein